MKSERMVRYMIEDNAPFSVHGEGITIQAVTRSRKPVQNGSITSSSSPERHRSGARAMARAIG